MSSEKQQYKRAYRACFGCRKRKVKCLIAENSPLNSPCERCKRELKECVIPASTNRGGIANVLAGKAKKRAREELERKIKEEELEVVQEKPGKLSRVQTTTFHRHQHPQVPGAIATDITVHTAAESQPIPSQAILAHAAEIPTPSQIAESPNLLPDSRGPNYSKAADHLNMLALFAIDHETGGKSKSMAPDVLWKREAPPPIPLHQNHVVQTGLLTEAEMVILIDFYKEKLHPFFPYLPSQLLDINNISGMSFFSTCLCCVAVLYYIPSSELGITVFPKHAALEQGLASRKAKLYQGLWEIFKSFLNLDQLVLELPDGPVATVMGLILTMNWSVNPEDESGSKSGPGERVYHRARRNDRMSWTFLGLTTAIIDSIGVMELGREVFVSFSLMDIGLSSKFNRSAMCPDFITNPSLPELDLTEQDMAKIELLKISGLASKLLYPSHLQANRRMSSGQHIYLLNAMKPHIELWTLKYQKYLSPRSTNSSAIDSHELSFLFHHLRTFVYRLALPSKAETANPNMLANYHPCETFLFSAIESAKEIMNLVEELHHEHLIRLVPLPWCSRMLHATTFLVKAMVFAPTAFHGETDINETLDRINLVSQILLQTGPDLCDITAHYASVLVSVTKHIKDTHNPSGIQQMNQNSTRFTTDMRPPPIPTVRYPVEPRREFDGFSELMAYGLNTDLTEIVDEAAMSGILFPPHQ